MARTAVNCTPSPCNAHIRTPNRHRVAADRRPKFTKQLLRGLPEFVSVKRRTTVVRVREVWAACAGGSLASWTQQIVAVTSPPAAFETSLEQIWLRHGRNLTRDDFLVPRGHSPSYECGTKHTRQCRLAVMVAAMDPLS